MAVAAIASGGEKISPKTKTAGNGQDNKSPRKISARPVISETRLPAVPGKAQSTPQGTRKQHSGGRLGLRRLLILGPRVFVNQSQLFVEFFSVDFQQRQEQRGYHWP